MPFSVGAEVVVTHLQRKGRILEVGASGRYRVAVGPLALWCDEAELATVSSAKKEARRNARAASGGPAAGGQVPPAHPTASQARALGSLDLHGMTVEEALHAVEVRLDEAIRAGLDRLEIIHGISGGRLRAAVRGYLAGIGSIARVAPDPRNAGVTWVYF
jgi:DNA mismatch repair protein MutS2